MKFYLKIVKEDSLIYELAWEESYNMEGQLCIHFWKIFNEQEGMNSKEGGMSRKSWAGQYSVALKWCSNEESMTEPMSLKDKCKNQIALFRIQAFQ